MFPDSEHWQVRRDGHFKREVSRYAVIRDLWQAAILPAIIQLCRQNFARWAFSSFIHSRCGGSSQEALHQCISPLDALGSPARA